MIVSTDILLSKVVSMIILVTASDCIVLYCIDVKEVQINASRDRIETNIYIIAND